MAIATTVVGVPILSLRRMTAGLRLASPAVGTKTPETVVSANATRLKELNAVVGQTELPLLMAHEAQLTQLLCELLDNAIKFRRDEPL